MSKTKHYKAVIKGQYITVHVIKRGRFFSLVESEWKVYDEDLSYTKRIASYKLNSRIFEV